MNEEKIEKKGRISNRNTNIGLAGMFLSIFFITGGIYCWVYAFGFIISSGIITSLAVMIWAVFSLIWIGYWWNKK